MILRDPSRPGPASYDPDGIRYKFVPPEGEDPSRYAIDVEHRDTPAPAPLKLYMGLDDDDEVYRRWTVLEVIAKLTGEPSLVLLQRFKWRHDIRAEVSGKIDIRRADTANLWVVAGYRLGE